jgi:hypothetical protein
MKRFVIAIACLGLLACEEETAPKPPVKPGKETAARTNAAKPPETVRTREAATEKAPATKPVDTAAAAPATPPDNSAVEVDCGKVMPASTFEVCGIKEPLKKTPQEGNKTVRTIICQRSTGELRTTHVHASVLDYGEERYAREVAGDPAPGTSTAKSERGAVTKALNTSATLYRGRYVIGANAATMNDDKPLCTPEQLDEIVKGMHARFPGN